jgi:hypothetical protein
VSSVISDLGGIAGNAAGEALAFGLGFALGRVLEPVAVDLSQTAWNEAPIRAVEPGDAAEIVAENVEATAWGESEAQKGGIDSDRFAAMVGAVLNAPGVPELMAMYRRGLIDDAALEHGFRKARLETSWDAPLTSLQNLLLDPSVIAVAIQRGIIADPGLLPVGPPTGGGTVPAFPVAQVDAITEAAGSGIDRERLAAMVGIVGLPPALGELLQLVNRDEIDTDDFYRGIAEGNTRNEWRDALLTLKRRILGPHEYAELALRGWIDDSARDAGAALSGMEPADTELLFNMLGRPLAVHQITTGLARGGTYGGVYEGVPEPFATGLRQSNVRPEWGNLAYANRYTIPSYFVLKAILTDGGMTADDFANYGKELGWPPELAEKAAAAFGGGTKAASDPHVTKAENQLWTRLHSSYIADEATDAGVTPGLEAAGVASDAVPAVLALWGQERALIRKQLTAAQIKKAIGQTGKDAAWATARLLDLGYNPDDAATFLAE